MDLHERYMHISTIDSSIFVLLENTFKDDPFPLLHRLVKHYNTEIMKDNLSAKQLDTFRMILCFEYQLLFHEKEKCLRIVPNELCFQTIQDTLLTIKQLENFIDYPILYDIITLQLTIYCNIQCIRKHMLKLRANIPNLITNESSFFYVKILECFLEALQLKKLLFNDLESDALKCFHLFYLQDMILWFQMKDNKDLQSFSSILPKLINTFGLEVILSNVWFYIIHRAVVKDLPSILSIIVDTCSLLNLKNTSDLRELYCMEELWLVIQEILKSPTQQFRKQALFTMNRIIDFMNTVDNSSFKFGVQFPFNCDQSIERKISDIKNDTNKYILIMEALEEKQHHLVLPALTHLPVLIKENEKHVVCNNCYNNTWLKLIFWRMLRHESNSVVKQGILYVSKFPACVRQTPDVLNLVIPIFNNTFLYECQTYQQEPEILNNITTFFVNLLKEKCHNFGNVVDIINQEVWAPIPIFYLIKVLSIISSNISKCWKDEELCCVKILVKENLNMHSHLLRIASQVELLKAFTISVKKITKLVIYVLMEFSQEEILVRNSYSWDVIVTWLNKLSAKQDVINFIQSIYEEYLRQYLHIRLSPAKFALIVVMFHDAGLILQDRTCPVKKILNDWLSLLRGINTRPYANVMHIFPIVEFMAHLLNLNIKDNKHIMQLLSLYVIDALQFLLKNSRCLLTMFNYEEVNRYLVTVVSFLNNENLILSERKILNYIEQFKNESTAILENVKEHTNKHYMYALYILHYTQNILCTKHISFYMQPLLTICEVRISNKKKEGETESKGKIVSDCYVLLAKLADQFLSKIEIELWPQIDWFESVSHLYEMGGNEIIPEVALVLKTLVNKGAIKNSEDKLKLESMFNTCWRATLFSTKNKIYFLAVKNLVKVIINNNFLVLPDITNFLDNFFEELLEESDNVPRLKTILLNEMVLLDVCCWKNLQKPLLSCLLHGHALRKDKQIENQVYLYIMKNYQDCYPRHIRITDYNTDANIRAASVVLLHKIINKNKKYASVFLPIVLQTLEKYKNKQYFKDSYIHKVKHRFMQILLILQPILTKEDTITLQEFLCNSIISESNQHSVRLTQEWVLTRIFLENIDLHDKLWEVFEKGITTRPGCVKSIICVVYHVSKLLPKDFQGSFIKKAMNYVTRCCLGQQYHMRLYSQIIFVKFYNKLEELNNNHIILQYKELYDAVITNLKDGLVKNLSKIQDDFYFTTFNAGQHYTLQTIYFELPRLSNMDASEWTTPDLFKTANFEKSNNHPLQLYNIDTSLSDTKTSYLIKPKGNTESSAKSCNTDFGELSDIQKKIDPVNTHNNICSTIRDSIFHKKVLNEDGLIVVASLVNRIPNLGGLARTCEIFCVKELVISNLNQIKDKEFQNLSVSAENWITITETKPHELCKYLLDKKQMGWSIVGIEQTANSTSLSNMKFNKKTILVLGNEKNGIAANLIPLFDICVEIPQAGVIRSLNVHVSGAICIWQYAQQHIFT